MTNWKQLAAQAQPTVKRVRLCLRGDLMADLAAADEAGDKTAADSLRAQVADAMVTFTFKGLTRQKYRALEAAHPDPDGGAGWNLESFPEALVRACCVDPVIEADDPLFDVLTPGQVESVFTAAFEACNEVDDLPFMRRG